MTEVSLENLLEFLRQKAPDNKCRKCKSTRFSIMGEEQRPSLAKISLGDSPAQNPEDAQYYFDSFAYYCKNCGTVEFVFHEVVEEWLSSHSARGDDG